MGRSKSRERSPSRKKSRSRSGHDDARERRHKSSRSPHRSSTKRHFNAFVNVRMSDVEKNVAYSKYIITNQSIRSAFLLPNDSVLSLSFKSDGIVVMCEARGNPEPCFLLPDGCETMKFFADSNKVPSRPATPMDEGERPSHADEDSQSFQFLSKYLFYTRILLKKDGKIMESDDMKYACAPFYSTLFPSCHFVVSTRHGPHECLEDGDKVNIYNSAHASFIAEVVFYSAEEDFVLFKTPHKVCGLELTAGSVVGGHRYMMLGYAELNQVKKEGEHLAPCFASGIIMSSQPNANGHVCGSSGGIAGFSGGPVFDLVDHQLIGICISTDDLDDRPTSFGRFSSDMIGYCKEITVVRILPVMHIATVYFASVNKTGRSKFASH